MAFEATTELLGGGPRGGAELVRQEIYDDKEFVRSHLYLLELLVPSEIAVSGSGEGTSASGMARVSFLFPLVLAPQSIQVSEPYTVAVTPGLDGGLFVEENGVLARTITVAATTGFKVRRAGYRAGAIQDAASKNFNVDMRGGEARLRAQALSGQAHFQFIQDRVFRTYSELKRSGTYARGVELRWHNLHDRESFRVIPLSFDSQRSIQTRFHFPHSFSLLAVAKASAPNYVAEAPGDASWLDQAKSMIASVKRAVALVQAAIGEITAFVNEVKAFVASILDIINVVSSVIAAAAAFVDAVVDLIYLVPNMLKAIGQQIEDACAALETAVGRFGAGPSALQSANMQQPLLAMMDGIDELGVQRAALQTSIGAKLALLDDAELAPSGTAPTVGSVNDVIESGTAPRSGDAARRALQGRRSGNRYRSTRPWQVGPSDTLSTIAARTLGDARRWRHIAALNGLTSPYISSVGLPGTVRPGATLLVPSTAAPASAGQGAGILGADPTADGFTQLLGTDLYLAPVAGGLYDLEVDSTGMDARTVAGKDNLVQAVRSRMLTAQGSCALYPALGARPLVGIGLRAAEVEVLRFRLREAVEADARIRTVSRVELNPGASPDAVVADITAEVLGIDATLTTQASVRSAA